MTMRRPRRPSVARERILKTAHDLFYRDGIRATGIDRVIADAQVTKVTFYRHFHSKDELIRAFLAYRHERWMAWFVDALRRYAGRRAGIAAALEEWLEKPEFRGCAFINVVAEMPNGGAAVAAIAREHKEDVRQAIAAALPPSPRRPQIAASLALAFDGAIVRAQMEGNCEHAITSLKEVERALRKRAAGGGAAR